MSIKRSLLYCTAALAGLSCVAAAKQAYNGVGDIFYSGPVSSPDFTVTKYWTEINVSAAYCTGTKVPCRVENGGSHSTVHQFAASNTRGSKSPAYHVLDMAD